MPSPATPIPSNQPSSANSVLLEPPPAKQKKKLGTFFKEHEEDQQVATSGLASLSPEQQCRKELEHYLSIPKLDFEDDPPVVEKC